MSLEDRKKYAEKIIDENPTRVPILVKSDNGRLKILKNEFLVPKQLKIIHFIATLRRSINLDPENAIYLYVDNKLIKQDKYIGEVYENHKDNDLFLRINATDLPALG